MNEKFKKLLLYTEKCDGDVATWCRYPAVTSWKGYYLSPTQ